ncbi:sulfurtransferase [Sanguibacter suarezii]|uniref:sulfurtransferase n=1 Tax=Sanguibacter suarezii TaxID=60921 RepID=UPI00082EB487|nr:rhodanese-like domain-containing protein [Sanguibacter suarezii]
MSTDTALLPTLVSSAELNEALAGPGPIRVLDATTFLHTTVEAAPYTASTGYEQYLDEHIPGALFADVPGTLSDTSAELLFTVPSPASFAHAVQDLGIGSDTHVVVYDTAGSAWATRVWWLFRVFGHDAVSVLDGGLGAWKAAGFPVVSGDADIVAVAAADTPVFTPRFRPELVATKAEIAATLPGVPAAPEGTVVVNALDPATFAGESEVNPYPRRGRIPGSVNVPLYTLLDPQTGQFLPAEQLTEKLQEQGVLDAQRAVTYCGGGIAATLPAFTAYVAAGVEVAVYDGSLSEWTADESLPVELG